MYSGRRLTSSFSFSRECTEWGCPSCSICSLPSATPHEALLSLWQDVAVACNADILARCSSDTRHAFVLVASRCKAVRRKIADWWRNRLRNVAVWSIKRLCDDFAATSSRWSLPMQTLTSALAFRSHQCLRHRSHSARASSRRRRSSVDCAAVMAAIAFARRTSTRARHNSFGTHVAGAPSVAMRSVEAYPFSTGRSTESR
mmetsp:Transcript_22207/g.69508  ORF Transcript_22207/g.69508 Transcript_22207/m.69508 type:complete len:201 (+) Transcript_22207:2112-2714(+)